jgi:1-acyl-sn-glycerol-3-phosphate acyltransferase
MTEYNFDPIRPYHQHEIPDAISRIVDDPQFEKLLSYLFPETWHDKLRSQLSKVTSTNEFQSVFMRPVISSILDKTAGELTVSGIENINPDKGYVYIANHRDIILDSSILALHLVRHNLETCRITWGDNLMISPLVVDIGKANRMITVFREGSPKEMLKNSILLSAYIRQTVVDKKQTVWIAQRKGRAKDGNDITDVSVLKMLSLTGDRLVTSSLKQLNIIPITISYEWEPCDGMKVRELYLSDGKEYVKEEGEDLNSIIGGVISNKGRIHMHFGQPINQSIDGINQALRPNEILHEIALEVDRQIQAGYKLWPSNYLAFDLLEKSTEYSSAYDQVTIDKFNRRLQNAIDMTGGDKEKVTGYFLKLYANPVYNQKR